MSDPKFLRTLIVTDLEPDDYVAILLLYNSSLLNPYGFSFLVTGWTDVRQKCLHLRKFLVENTDKNPWIFMGEPCENDYVLPYVVDEGETSALNTFDALPAENSYDLIICLAPPRELFLREWLNGKTDLWIYGSFNVRSLLWNKFFTETQLKDFLATFNKVIWCESFFVCGQKNSVQDIQLYAALPQMIRDHIDWWNGLIVKNCREAVSDLKSTPDKIARNQKIIDNIEKAPYQFVNADCALIALMIAGIDPIRCTIEFGSYTTATPSESGNCYVFKGDFNDQIMSVFRNYLLPIAQVSLTDLVKADIPAINFFDRPSGHTFVENVDICIGQLSKPEVIEKVRRIYDSYGKGHLISLKGENFVRESRLKILRITEKN